MFKLEKNKSLGIDRHTDRRLRCGKLKIDYRVDFHGMSLEMAFDLLVQSIIQSYQKGFKCLLLITGKGKNTLEGHISIKSQLENWLQLPELSEKIIKYVDALPSDGGTGAVYLLLKTKH